MGGEEGLGVTTGQPNLYKQDLSKLDVNKLTALSPEVISRQATINIGTIGHVAHGKSTIVKAISGVQTVRFKNELERNITIKLDARAAENSSGEMAQVPDEITKMTSLHEKRAAPSENSQPKAKQQKIEEKMDGQTVDLKNFTECNNDERTAEIWRETTCDGLPMNELTKIIEQDKELSRAEEKVQLAKNLIASKMQLKELRIELEDIGRTRLNKYLSRSSKHTRDRQTREERKRKSKPKDNVYEVEKIVAKKVVNDVVLYLVKWKNWSEDQNTWEPVGNLENCPDMLRSFEKQNSKTMEKLQAVVKFHPKRRDLEQYMEQLSKNGKPITPEEIDIKEIERVVNNYILKKSEGKLENLEKKIREMILSNMLLAARREQMVSLSEWEKEMNSISKGKPVIRVENVVDLECAPQDFFYIDDYLPGSGVIIPDEPPIGCECEDCATTNGCCFNQGATGKTPYTVHGKVRVPPGTPIYECNKRCKCGSSCQNRVVQRGAYAKLCVFRTSNGTGWGVKTLRNIRKGSFVTQYVGEVLISEEAEKRGKQYDAAGKTYLFDLDYNETEGQCPYTVDAAVYGNISHFINHSCDPNLVVYGVWINCLDPNLPKLALFARRDIKQDEEITFDYMCQKTYDFDKLGKGLQTEDQVKADSVLSTTRSESRQRLQLPESSTQGEIPTNRTKCKCGTKVCRQYLF